MNKWKIIIHTNVGERLIEEAGPLACNVSHFHVTFCREHFEDHVAEAATEAHRAFDAQNHVAFGVKHTIVVIAARTVLLHAAHLHQTELRITNHKLV